MAILDQFWMVLLTFLTHPASQGIATSLFALFSALITLRLLPDFVSESTLLPRGTKTATFLRVVLVLVGAATFAALAAWLVMALPRP